MDGHHLARIDTAEFSLAIDSDARGGLTWRHLGSRVGAYPDGSANRHAARATFSLEVPSGVPLVGVANSGWFGPPGIDIRRPDGVGLYFAPVDSRLEATADSLMGSLKDPITGVVVTVAMQVMAEGALRIETAIENGGSEPVVVARLASAMFPVPSESGTVLSWRGFHASEWNECVEPLPAHGWYRESRIGITGHGGPPGFYLCPPGAPFDSGLTLAAQLAWSGDSRLGIERLADGRRIATLEAVLQPDDILLAPGARYTAPAVLLGISMAGRNGAMAQQHAAVRESIVWPGRAMAPRPVHLNSWEACYFAQDEAKMMALAEAAASLGVERFVLDDGWFCNRSDDRRALGDWTPDPIKYPRGLAPLARTVASLGMQFGLWVEPEMVSPDSDLYRSQPSWALSLPGQEGPLGRNQLVLDMRKAEVRDHLCEVLDGLLAELPISYLKWDHNRAHAPSGGAHQVKGTYELLSRLRRAHPDVEIESCASGGGRCDAGIASFVSRFWTSDNLDAVSRADIQRGFVAFLPPETMGAHVGASPAHATGRHQSLAFAAAIACMGHFGVELDPLRLNQAERDELANWIAFYKDWRGVIHGGEVRLGSGADGLTWQAHGDGSQWLLFAIRTRPARNQRPQSLPLPFLRGAHWDARLLRLAGGNRWLGTNPWTMGGTARFEFDGDWLAGGGLPLPPTAGEAVAIFHFGRTA